MSFVGFFRWADHSWLGAQIRSSTWEFAAIEVVHLLALTVLLGTVFVLTLRLFGLGLSAQSTGQVARGLMPWTLWSMVIAMATGFMLFVSEAMKCYASPPFMIKMICLGLAFILTLTFHRAVARWDDGRSPGMGGKLAAGLAMALWFGVGLAGRAIAFF